MSFGGLNISQHKTWHPWNRDALEKVARDKAQVKADKEKAEKRQRDLVISRLLPNCFKNNIYSHLIFLSNTGTRETI
jgi:hypothetical protein